MNDEQHSGGTTPQEQPHQANTGMAVVAYLLFFVPLLTDAKNDPFVKFHVKQGLLVFLLWVAGSVLSVLPGIMAIGYLVHVAALVFLVLGILNALHSKQQPLPLIGHMADHFTF